MTPEQVLSLIVQTPALAIMAYVIYKLYEDSREDREQAAKERAAMLEQLINVEKAMMQLSNDISNLITTYRRRGG